MNSADLRRKYIDFFVKKDHRQIPSALLVPENDPTTLFTSSGMQPLIRYLLGQPHPAGKRLVNSQKCFRAQDIDEVGDNRHTTFFEMLGNWSLGDYFKKEQLRWIFEFLTGGLGLPAEKLYVTVFAGNQMVPKDTDSIQLWKELFAENGIEAKEGVRIFAYPAAKNWWSRSGEPEKMPAGEPGGPDSEVFFDFGENLRTHENSIYKNEQCHPNCDCGRFMEIANSVFMQYQKQSDGSLAELKQKNVDFGGGLERLAAAVGNDPDIFNSDMFAPIIRTIEKTTRKSYSDEANKPAIRIIADHLKAATLLVIDGVIPSNKLQGYILRRLIRRATVKLHSLERIANEADVTSICDSVMDIYHQVENFFDKEKVKKLVFTEIWAEVQKFQKTLEKGLKLVGETSPFDLFQSYGFPPEITEELLKQKGLSFDKNQFEAEFRKHQQLSRAAAGMFKGGLTDHSEAVTKLHTATHLLHAALRTILGIHVQQKGSHITAERLRFDFSHSAKLTDEQRQKIEDWVNHKISQDLPVAKHASTLEKAKQEGALAFFGERYEDKVNVYSIGDEKTGIVSQEVCGGPHVDRTKILGRFHLGKEESVGAGIRRLYATIS